MNAGVAFGGWFPKHWMFRKGSVELLSLELEKERGLNNRPDFSRQGTLEQL